MAKLKHIPEAVTINFWDFSDGQHFDPGVLGSQIALKGLHLNNRIVLTLIIDAVKTTTNTASAFLHRGVDVNRRSMHAMEILTRVFEYTHAISKMTLASG